MKMPKRQPTDGEVSVTRPREGVVVVHCVNDGDASAVAMSEYNAWRAMAMLSVVLGVPLSKEAQKMIKL